MDVFGAIIGATLALFMLRKAAGDSWDTWWLPFGWVIAIPIVTLTLQWLIIDELGLTARFSGCRVSQTDELTRKTVCEASRFFPALLPGLLNLVAFAWYFDPRPLARPAALIAGTCGLIRFLVPLAGLVARDRVTFTDSLILGHTNSLNIWGPIGWVLTVVVAMFFAWDAEARGRRQRQTARGGSVH